MSAAEAAAIWQAWNALPEHCETPVRTIAAQLGATPAEVAAVVYPEPTFGPWRDEYEPER
jgi:hypothetical protein